MYSLQKISFFLFSSIKWILNFNGSSDIESDNFHKSNFVTTQSKRKTVENYRFFSVFLVKITTTKKTEQERTKTNNNNEP